MNEVNFDLLKNKIVVLLSFIGLSLIIFSSSTGRIFLSDDYCTLNNVVSGNVLLGSFFRPVGDLTLKWNYILTGWDPFYFYVTNIVLHAFNSFLIYWFCIKWLAREHRASVFSVVAGLIFLTYPSHSEAILWAIGRGISLAVTFSLLAMICFLSHLRAGLKYVLVCLLYFIALACYESVLLLPLILGSLAGKMERRQKTIWLLAFITTLAFHLILRFYFTGGIWRAYDGVIFSKDAISYISILLKILLRLFVPPFNNPALFALTGAIVVLFLAVIVFRNRTQIIIDKVLSRAVPFSLAGLFFSIIVAVSFGLSTRTSEGDRLLYLPSCFYAIMMAALITRMIRHDALAFAVFVLFISFHLTFVVVNQRNWNIASDQAVKVISGVRANPQRPLFIINLPSDHKGAFVFRNCLRQALLHYDIDSSGIRILNILQGTRADELDKVITPSIKGDNVFIPPSTTLTLRNGVVESITSDSLLKVRAPLSSILYWNKLGMVALEGGHRVRR